MSHDFVSQPNFMSWDLFLRALLRFILHNNLIDSNDKVLVAVSAGIDSTLLLESLVAIADDLELSEIGVVYVDHGLRPEQTYQEFCFVSTLAQKLGVQYYLRTIEIDKNKGSIQEQARRKRRTTIEKLASDAGFFKIATAHHADDQAETVLMRILRGTFSKGISGIWPKSGWWIHPFLPFTRSQIEALIKERGLSWIEDSSNKTVKYQRNRIRHQLLPFLEKDFNPKIKNTLNRLSNYARQDDVFFQKTLSKLWKPPLIIQDQSEVTIDLTAWDTLDKALQWRVLSFSVSSLGHHDLQHCHIEQILSIVKSRSGEKYASISSELSICRRYDRLHISILSPKRGCRKSNEIDLFSVKISKSGVFDCPSGSLQLMPYEQLSALNEQRVFWQIFVQISSFPNFPWCLRNRKIGDRLQFENGHKTLKKWMITEKIPRSGRTIVPILCVENRLLWVPGYRFVAPFSETRTDSSDWCLRFYPNSRFLQIWQDSLGKKSEIVNFYEER